MLVSFAHRLERSARLRHGLFAVAAWLAILFIGYHYGTFDQAIHIPFLKKFADPTLYLGNDEFFNLRFQHYSYFWFLFLPFYQWGILEPVLFVAHYLATYLTFWAIWALTDTLFHDPLAGLIAVVTFITPHIGFSSFPIFEFSLLNRTAALPFLLIAINLFLRKRVVGSLALVGVIYNFHVLSATFVLCLLLAASVWQIRRIGWRTLGRGLVVFLLAALPLLVWRALSPPVQLAPQPDWFTTISQGMFLHLFYLIAPYPHILMVTASGICALILFLIAAQHHPTEHTVTMQVFILAAVGIVGVQGALTYLFPITVLMQAQIMRAGFLALLLGYIYVAGYLAARWRTEATPDHSAQWLTAAFAVDVFPVATLAVWGIQRWGPSGRWRQVLAGTTILGMFVLTIGVAQIYQLWSPGVHLYARPTPWHQAQEWAKACTPKDAIFITPMHKWWLYDADWRVFSERSQVVSWADLLEIAIVPDYYATWKERFSALAPGALEQFHGDAFNNRRITQAAYDSLSDTTLYSLAQHYGAKYVVVEKPHLRPWPVVYENDEFVIYALGESVPAPCAGP